MTTIKLKRSDVAGKVPQPADLELGELALNTADGKVFLKTDGGEVRDVTEIVPYVADDSAGIQRTVTERLREEKTLQDYGAVANQDSTAAVQAAINNASGKIHGAKGPFPTTGISNPLGVEIDPSVQVLVDGKLYNTYARQGMVWGQELLFGWINKIRSNQDLKIVFTGDSTTAGIELPTEDVYPNLVKNTLDVMGFHHVSVSNRGQFGHTTLQWDTEHVVEDIAEEADLYVVRWGLNDPGAGHTLSQYASYLRSGLAKIRAQYPLSSGVSILLMTPNSTDDDWGTYPRDYLWHEEVVKIHRRAAQDYGCAFIDTYGMFQNSHQAGTLWMDAMKVHPYGNLNTLIASAVIDMILPTVLRNLYKRPPVWQQAQLETGWGGDIHYYVDKVNKIVHVKGLLTDGDRTTEGAIVGNIPANLAPPIVDISPTLQGGWFTINNAGVITIHQAPEILAFVPIETSYILG